VNTGVAEAVAHVVDDLANELQLSFDWFENQFERRIDTLHVSGGGSRILSVLRSICRRRFAREVVDFDPFAGLGIDAAVDADLLRPQRGSARRRRGTRVPREEGVIAP
jgi:Tfp pilus assembly PilM family ATPase